MQIYIVDRSYKELGLGQTVNDLCKSLRVEIDDISMFQFNNLILKSKKTFPLDGLESKDIWDLNMQTGLKLRQLHKLELIDDTFKERMLNIIHQLTLFSSVADGAKIIINKGEKL